MHMPVVDLMAPLDERVSQVLSVAVEEAKRLENSHVAVEHLLLGVMRLENRVRRWRVHHRKTSNLVHQILFDDGNLSVRRVEDIIRRQNVNYVRRYVDSPPLDFSQDARHALRLANDEVHWMDYHVMTAAHLLLGIVLQPKGFVVAQALRMDPDQVCSRLRQQLPKAHGQSRYTAPAKVALSLAQEAAQELRHSQLGTAHLLLGLAREPYGVAGKVLKHLGVQTEHIKARVLQMIPSEERAEIMGLSTRYKQLLNAAGNEMRSRHHQFIGTGHLLSCLVRLEGSVAVRALRRLNIKVEDVSEHMSPYLSQQLPIAEAVEGGDLAFLGHQVDVTQSAHLVFTAAVEEANRLEHRTVNTGHILIGLMLADDDRLRDIFSSLGIKHQRVRGLVELMTSQTYSLRPRHLANDLKRAIRYAVQDRDVLDTMPLLYAIMRDPSFLAVKILKQMRVNFDMSI